MHPIAVAAGVAGADGADISHRVGTAGRGHSGSIGINAHIRAIPDIADVSPSFVGKNRARGYGSLVRAGYFVDHVHDAGIVDRLYGHTVRRVLIKVHQLLIPSVRECGHIIHIGPSADGTRVGYCGDGA